ncbi:MAG TPA: hypothetical protein VIS96_13120 [Terrimicrobiaceae bacterium]
MSWRFVKDWRKAPRDELRERAKEVMYFLYDKLLLPLRFDEKYYLKAYPEVADEIASGRYRSAIEHYRFAGRQLSLAYSGSSLLGCGRNVVNDVPVAFFVFNRPALTQVVFDEIRRFAPTTLLIIADGPRNDAERQLCEEVLAIVKEVDWPCRVLRNLSDTNLGCKNRMSSGLRWVFEQVEEAIILEDDCLPDPTFFSFCSHLLICYRDDSRVMHISGSCFLRHPCTRHSYWFSRHSDIWGWATWRRAFRHYDVSMSSWPAGRLRRSLIWRDRIERRAWTKTFDATHAGSINTWDNQWHWNVYKRNAKAIVPRTNLITNLGFGAFATHTHDPNVPTANLATQSIHKIWHPPRFQRQPQADFEVFSSRYYLRDHLARREALIPAFRGPIDFIVTHDLPVFAHGVGALIQKVFEGSRPWASIRSEEHHDRHKAPVPSLLIRSHSSEHPNRLATMCATARAIGESPVRGVLAVPYSDQDCLNALALSYLYSVPLRLWLMDDQNIYGDRISDSLMRELIERSVLRLAICEEMKEHYETKFGYPFKVQMPVERECDLVDRALLATLRDPPKFVSCGNVWCDSTMRTLMEFTRSERFMIDWYGNLGNDIAHEELAAGGIRVQGSLPHGDLIARLREYDAAIVAMPDNSSPGRAWQACLSFPSKIITLSVAGNLPILFAGPRDNPGASFIRKNDLGETCEWAPAQFSAALGRILSVGRLAQIRRNAARISRQFSASPVAEKIWRELNR